MCYYLAYGSNLWLRQMQERCPGYEVVHIGKLDGYTLEFKRIYENAYATIEKGEGFTNVVIYRLSKANELSLDEYEGVPEHYTKETIEMTIDGVSYQVLTYIMNQEAVYDEPKDEYKERLRLGYNDFGFDYRLIEESISRAKKESMKLMRT